MIPKSAARKSSSAIERVPGVSSNESRPPLRFETSREIKTIFNEQFAAWKKKHGGTLELLAHRCGVTASYLGHVGRYGRIPGRPVLLLLAFNFELKDPELLLRAAKIEDPWPYDPSIRLRATGPSDHGFLSVQLDMNGFTETIRSIIKAETRNRSISDLTRGRPIRVGMSLYQDWLFAGADSRGKKRLEGLFPEFIDLLGLTFQHKIVTRPIHFTEYVRAFEDDEIDIFGPVAAGPLVQHGLQTAPFCRVGLSALVRTKPSTYLPYLPAPRSVEDLIKGDYVIAVFKNARSHLFANTRLGRKDDELIMIETVEEGLERLTLSGIPRSAHILLIDSVNGHYQHELAKGAFDLAFATPETMLKISDNVLLVRPDWPELVSHINQALEYLSRTGTLADRFDRWIPANKGGLVEMPSF